MDLQEHFLGFYEAITLDQRISATHISLYMALLFQHVASLENPIHIERTSVMQRAKISARSTYNKCMHELNEYGYVKYVPSYNFYLKSLVYIRKV
ncbi:MAG TPA: hypothetical protein VK787_06635 [Puia sp.]|nr:hypothetical protein [Puia sp.]